jgi:hypothetical protein
VIRTIIQFFSSRKESFTVEFEKNLADKIQQKYQNSKQLVHVIRHWREDDEFARQVSGQSGAFSVAFIDDGILYVRRADEETVTSIVNWDSGCRDESG